jgi:GDP-L-fucose synthase
MTVGYNDELVFDNTKPDGARCKVKDVLKLNSLGCSRTTKLEAGLKNIYTWFKGNIN